MAGDAPVQNPTRPGHGTGTPTAACPNGCPCRDMLDLLGEDACRPLAHLRTWVEDDIDRFPAAG
ncbi:hypothetical protein ACFZDK_42025 [Streptomyces sp. NPDC007901]|uniref:hypothetical protein n=1 Tax=Streptomyces sp. NPDC007901 TaxID=3364785 RepID=UPI0036E5EB7E